MLELARLQMAIVYSSLSIINIGSEKLTHLMRLLAVNAMINNSDYFQTLCKVLQYSFEEQLKRTAMDTIWGAEVQIQALSMAVSHPIHSYIQFNSDPKNRHYISSNISLQELIDRFIKGTLGGHLKYIGYESDMNKVGLCIYYNGSQYDALLPFRDNPQQFVPHFDIINMSFKKKHDSARAKRFMRMNKTSGSSSSPRPTGQQEQ